MYWKEVDPPTKDGLKQMFECICGKQKMVNMDNVKRGKSTSCGCGGQPKVPKELKRVFTLIKYRCNTETSPDYSRWGGNGIKVLYASAHELYQDIGDKPSKIHSIDRIDGTRHYEKGNCRWATPTEQNNNLKSNRPLCYNGVTNNLSEWAKEKGLLETTIRHRLETGMTVEEALDTPVDQKKSGAGKISHAKKVENGFYSKKD